MDGRTIKGLMLLAAVALALRVGLVLAVATEHDAPVTYEHGAIAKNLLAGRGFSVWFLGSEGPTSQQAPLYPLMLAGLYRLFGVESREAILAMQLLQSAAGAATALCVCWLGWSLVPARRSVGWLAGWGAALYPTHIYMATHIQVVTWAALVMTLLTAVVLMPGQTRSLWRGFVAGLLAGVLLLLDPILAVVLPVLALGLSMREGERERGGEGKRKKCGRFAERRFMPAAAMTLTALAVISPWLWRNYAVHGEVVFVKSTFGYAFWQGNNPLSWGTDKVPKPSAEALRRQHDGTLAGIDKALWEARHETVYIDDVLLKPGGYRKFAGLTEPQRSRLLMDEAIEFITAHPGRYAQLCQQRLRYFLLFDETNPKAANLVYRLTTLVWLSLGVAGLAVACRRNDAGARLRRTLWPTVAIFAAVMLFHTLTIVSARFRIPVEPLSFVWCAVAVQQGIDLLTNRRESLPTPAQCESLRPRQPASRSARHWPATADRR
jgi:hypothetical protein